jgi:lactate dehydrogenase-like 2-hydroxyacid dehydrogenase
VRPSVLITKRIYPEAVDFISQHCEIDYEATDNGLPAAELLKRIEGKQAVVSQLTDKFTPEVMGKLKGVKIISNVAVGFDNVNVPAATAAGILVSNTPDVLTDTTADFAFALLLAAARRVVEGYQFLQAGKWQKWAIDLLVGQDVHHRTIGIIGLGRIGQSMARRCKGFSMRILYADARRAPEEVERELGAQFVPLDELLRQSDFVSIHVPLSEQTKGLIGAEELALMKPTAILVNTSRGPVVDEAAVVNALRAGTIGGVGLDVFEKEPQIHPGLLELPQAVLAPHIASASVDTRRKMSMMAVENAVAALHGNRPPNLVNPELWERLPGRKEA